MSWLSRLRNRWREPDLAREFDAELRFHLDSRIEANLRRGMAPDEAATEARRHLGNLTRAREGMREARVATWLDGLGGDLRHGVRVFGRHPLLTALSILTLSLGIGANAAIFSVFEAVLLRPLPYPAAERLVVLMDGRRGDRERDGADHSRAARRARGEPHARRAVLLRHARLPDRPAATSRGASSARASRRRSCRCSACAPALGRIFDEADRFAGMPRIVVLGSGLWRQNFGADPAVVGRTLAINGTTHEIVGVLPETFSFAYLSSASVDLYVPYPTSPEYLSRSGEFANVRRVNALARLAPGVSLETAERRAGRDRGVDGRGPSGSVSSERRRVRVDLLHARDAAARVARPEQPPGAADAARRGRSGAAHRVRQHRAVPAGAGDRAGAGSGGAQRARRGPRPLDAPVRRPKRCCWPARAAWSASAQAVWLTGVLRRLVPRGTPIVGDIGLDGRVLLVVLAVTLVAAIVCVLVPALRFSRAGLAGPARGARRGRRRRAAARWRSSPRKWRCPSCCSPAPACCCAACTNCSARRADSRPIGWRSCACAA